MQEAARLVSPQTRGVPLHRHPYLVWQISTLVLTVLVAAGILALADPDVVGWPTYVGVGALCLSTVTTYLLHTRVVGHQWRIAMPVLSLGALVVMGADILPVMPTAALVILVPLLWLVFEFGRRGTVVALIGLATVLTLIFSSHIVPAGSGPAWMQFLPVPFTSVGLLLGSHQLASALRRREEVLKANTRLLETTLENSQHQLLLLRAILDTVDAVIVAYDDDGQLIQDNPAARRMVPLAGVATDGSLVGPLHIYYPDSSTPVARQEIPLARAHRGEEFTTELHWFGPPGDQAAVILSSRQIPRADSGRYGYVIVGLDITDVMEAIRVREEFLTTVSHELRTPLTSIIGYHELIEDDLGPDDEALRAMLTIAQRNAHVLLTRVSQLLQASGSGGQPTLARRTLDLDQLMSDVLTNHHPVAASLGVALDHEIEPGLEGHLDPDQFEQVVDNLISNALKYTPAGGKVCVRVEHVGEALSVTVTDTGIGMNPAEQRHAFERFYRAAGATQRAIPGLGIGLAAVKSIVEAHGGQVELRSRPGAGTSVTVTIPDVRN